MKKVNASALMLAAIVSSTAVLAGPVLPSSAGGITSKTVENYQFNINLILQAETLDTFTTQILGFLSGNATPAVVFNFNLPVSDASVQSVFATVRDQLAIMAGGLVDFSVPTLALNDRSLFSSATTSLDAPIIFDGREYLLDVNTQELVGEDTFAITSSCTGDMASCNSRILPGFIGYQYSCTTLVAFWPACTGTFTENLYVAPGDSVLLTSALIGYDLQRTVTTTDTYLTNQVWSITATPQASGVPISAPTWPILGAMVAFLLSEKKRNKRVQV